MSNKRSPVIIKRDTLESWSKAKNYIPNNGVIIIVDMPDKSIQLKLGDGETLVNDLPNILDLNGKQKNASVDDDGMLYI